MHELAVTEGIVKVALKYAEQNNAQKVLGIRLRIGEMSHILEEMLVKMFHHLSRGTIMEGAQVTIEWTPIILQCASCGETYPVKIKEIADCECPACHGKKFSMLSGREFHVESIEVM